MNKETVTAKQQVNIIGGGAAAYFWHASSIQKSLA
jgi:hypothetical protein